MENYLDLIAHARSVIEAIVKGSGSGRSLARNASILTLDSSQNCDRIFGIVRGWLMLLVHHGAPNEVLKDFVEGAACYLNVSSEKQFVSRCKYMCTAPMAEFLRNELPAMKDERWLPKKNFRRWYRSRIAKVSRVNVHLWFSWVQAKRSACQLTENMIALNYMEHHDAMLRPDPMEPALIDFSMELLAPVLELAKAQIAKCRLDPPLANASRSAAFESSRACGGQMGHLARYLGIDREVDNRNVTGVVSQAVPDGSQTLYHDRYTGVYIGPVVEDVEIEGGRETINELDTQKLFAMRETGLTTRKGAEHWGVSMIMTDPVAMERWTADKIDTDSYAMAARELGLEPKPGLDRQIYRDALHESMSDSLHCTIQAVVEPLKIRTISKGNALSYYVSGGYQKALHGALRQLNCFRLIGRPVSPTDLMDLVYECEEKLYWISGDYKASTDNLSAGLSRRINRYLAADLPFELVYRACLEPHVCHYPSVKVDESLCEEFKKWCHDHSYDCADYIKNKDGEIWIQIPDVTQVNAQLMGSRVSFPILCLANLALYLIVKCKSTGIENPSRTQIILWMNRVLINGDDILFCGPLREFELLRIWGAKVGLELSVGKAYVHELYANVNSTSFVMRLDTVGATPREIQYLNTGLFFGQHKVHKTTGEGENEDQQTHYVAVIDRIMDGCLPGRQKKVLGSYLSLHNSAEPTDGRPTSAIVRECGGRNLFIHRSLGGMGVACPVGWTYEVTRLQMAYAVRIMRSWSASTVPAIQPYQFRTIPKFESEKIISPWRPTEVGQGEFEALSRAARKRAAVWVVDDADRAMLEIGIVPVAQRPVNMTEADWSDLGEDFNKYSVAVEKEFADLDALMRDSINREFVDYRVVDDFHSRARKLAAMADYSLEFDWSGDLD